jgi:hypothetical protein
VHSQDYLSRDTLELKNTRSIKLGSCSRINWRLFFLWHLSTYLCTWNCKVIQNMCVLLKANNWPTESRRCDHWNLVTACQLQDQLRCNHESVLLYDSVMLLRNKITDCPVIADVYATVRAELNITFLLSWFVSTKSNSRRRTRTFHSPRCWNQMKSKFSHGLWWLASLSFIVGPVGLQCTNSANVLCSSLIFYLR